MTSLRAVLCILALGIANVAAFAPAARVACARPALVPVVTRVSRKICVNYKTFTNVTR